MDALVEECLLDMGFLPFIFVTRIDVNYRGNSWDTYIYIYMFTALIPILNYGEILDFFFLLFALFV